ncbi:MAG: hypothetical protein IT385_22235 [Deltaproteobacteria bacterium]|nr:hypothetical protein [Deltaproteobacteria bacterium]
MLSMSNLGLLVIIVGSSPAIGCGGDGDDATDVADTSDTGAEVTGCGDCGVGRTCCPSRFAGDIPRCVDTQLNPENCGACGTLCGGACQGGDCIDAPECQAGSTTCPGDLVCSAEGGGPGRCCPVGTTFIMSPADFFGCCPDGDTCGCVQGQCPISLASAKADIRYLGPVELAALGRELLATRLATWRYKGEPTARRQLGFIIDDGVPAAGIAADGGHVDLYGYISAAVAALQGQQRELDALRARLDAIERRLERAP